MDFIRGHTLQPQWYKILKVFLLLAGLAGYSFFFGWKRTLIFSLIFFGLASLVHLTYRAKTQKFTRSWLDFEVTEQEGRLQYRPIGKYYYLAVISSLLLAFLLSQLV